MRKGHVNFISFPSFCASIGGAEWVRIGRKHARVKMPDSKIAYVVPVVEAKVSLTSFALADLVKKYFK